MKFGTHESFVATLCKVTTVTLIIGLSAPTRSADQVTVYVMYSSYMIWVWSAPNWLCVCMYDFWCNCVDASRQYHVTALTQTFIIHFLGILLYVYSIWHTHAVCHCLVFSCTLLQMHLLSREVNLN